MCLLHLQQLGNCTVTIGDTVSGVNHYYLSSKHVWLDCMLVLYGGQPVDSHLVASLCDSDRQWRESFKYAQTANESSCFQYCSWTQLLESGV